MKLKTITYHLIFWLLYLLSEYLANLMHLRDDTKWRFIYSVLLSLPILMGATYFITLVVVPKYLIQKKYLAFSVAIILTAAFVFYGRIKWLELINYLEHNEYYKMPASKVLKNVIRDYAIIALAVCISIISDWRRKQLLNEQLIKAKAEAEIKLLKGQLQPHFLFNSLNNIYSLALMKSDQTADSILRLTELLEFLIYKANQDHITLSKEVQLLENYVALEQLRHGEKLQISLDISLENDSIQVAPLLLLPFAENCFKHGGTGKEGLFKIDMNLKATEKALSFSIENSKKDKSNKTQQVGGIGLTNIKKRLELLYPKAHKLKIEDLKEHYQVQLEIKFKD